MLLGASGGPGQQESYTLPQKKVEMYEISILLFSPIRYSNKTVLASPQFV